MKVLTLTSLFPNNVEQNKGIFIKQRASALAKLAELKVIAPVAWFPGKSMLVRNFGKIRKFEKQGNLDVYHPKYFYIPKIFRSLYGAFYFLSLYWFVKKINKKFDFDIIDAHWAYPDGFAAVLIAKLLKKKVSVSLRGSDINRYTKSFLLKQQIKYSLNKSDLVIAVSDKLGLNAKKKGVRKRIVTIPNGIDTGLFKSMDKDNVREKLALPKDKKIILFIGGLIKRKGLDHLINALSLISDKRKDVLLLIIGEGGAEGDETANLKKQISSSKLSSNVDLLGSKPHEEISLWINSCDVFCLPSLSEGCPNVVLESLACGRPVVASDVGGIPSMIRKDCGILVPPKNARKLAEALDIALGKKWNAKEIAKYGRSNTWEMVAQKIYKYMAKGDDFGN